MANPQIVEYIEKNRERYTRAAIDSQLREAGYGEREIAEGWEVAKADGERDAVDPRRFWRLFWLYAVGLNLLALVAVGLAIGAFADDPDDPIGWGGIFVVVFGGMLAIGLLVAAGIVAMTGAVRRRAQTAILIGGLVPFVIVVIIAGWCLSIGSEG